AHVAGGHGGKRTCWADAQREERKFAGSIVRPPFSKRPNSFDTERPRVAGRKYCYRRKCGVGSNPETEGSQGARHRGISAEQGGDVMRILSGRAAEARVKQLAARNSQFGTVEPRVRKIVDDVRRDGDRALSKYASQWDGLKVGDSIRI